MLFRSMMVQPAHAQTKDVCGAQALAYFELADEFV